MLICHMCHKEMKVVKNGVHVDYGNGHVYSADKWQCPICTNIVYLTNSTPFFDKEHYPNITYFDMNSKVESDTYDYMSFPSKKFSDE
jgi:hypothetical protein